MNYWINDTKCQIIKCNVRCIMHYYSWFRIKTVKIIRRVKYSRNDIRYRLHSQVILKGLYNNLWWLIWTVNSHIYVLYTQKSYDNTKRVCIIIKKEMELITSADIQSRKGRCLKEVNVHMSKFDFRKSYFIFFFIEVVVFAAVIIVVVLLLFYCRCSCVVVVDIVAVLSFFKLKSFLFLHTYYIITRIYWFTTLIYTSQGVHVYFWES